jgi:uncharacterized phage-associated protein
MYPLDDPSAIDVAEYILSQRGAMDAMKLEKLCYYGQAWSLAWRRGRMFRQSIEAWEKGPMIRDLFRRHKGQYWVSTVNGDPTIIAHDDVRRATMDRVLDIYGAMSGEELSDLTHSEDPWILTRARANAAPGDPCDEVIEERLMAEYYRGLIQRRRAAMAAAQA